MPGRSSVVLWEIKHGILRVGCPQCRKTKAIFRSFSNNYFAISSILTNYIIQPNECVLVSCLNCAPVTVLYFCKFHPACAPVFKRPAVCGSPQKLSVICILHVCNGIEDKIVISHLSARSFPQSVLGRLVCIG